MTVRSSAIGSGWRLRGSTRRGRIVAWSLGAGVLAAVGAAGAVLALHPAALDRIRDGTPLQPSPLERARAEAPHDIDQGIASLAARLKQEPNDVEGWALLSRSYLMVGNNAAAAEASLHVAALRAQDPGALARQAETHIADAGGIVEPMARRLIDGTLSLDPGNVRARFYLGLAQAQDDQSRQALQTWLALEADAPAGADWLDGLRANIDRLVEAAAIDAPTLAKLRRQAADAHAARIVAQPASQPVARPAEGAR